MRLHSGRYETNNGGITALDRAHYQTIDISDGIYVLNIDGHIGASVRKEMDHARQHGKEAIYHCKQQASFSEQKNALLRQVQTT